MNALIYRAVGFSTGAAAELELGYYHFPPELARLALGPLLRLIRSLGLLGEKVKLRRKQRPFRGTDLITAIQAGRVYHCRTERLATVVVQSVGRYGPREKGKCSRAEPMRELWKLPSSPVFTPFLEVNLGFLHWGIRNLRGTRLEGVWFG